MFENVVIMVLTEVEVQDIIVPHSLEKLYFSYSKISFTNLTSKVQIATATFVEDFDYVRHSCFSASISCDDPLLVSFDDKRVRYTGIHVTREMLRETTDLVRCTLDHGISIESDIGGTARVRIS